MGGKWIFKLTSYVLQFSVSPGVQREGSFRSDNGAKDVFRSAFLCTRNGEDDEF